MNSTVVVDPSRRSASRPILALQEPRPKNRRRTECAAADRYAGFGERAAADARCRRKVAVASAGRMTFVLLTACAGRGFLRSVSAGGSSGSPSSRTSITEIRLGCAALWLLFPAFAGPRCNRRAFRPTDRPRGRCLEYCLTKSWVRQRNCELDCRICKRVRRGLVAPYGSGNLVEPFSEGPAESSSRSGSDQLSDSGAAASRSDVVRGEGFVIERGRIARRLFWQATIATAICRDQRGIGDVSESSGSGRHGRLGILVNF